ncbi:MAG: hypothetical protein HQK81_15605 [Desulfovibrionaceae bacterium]|nr:hypothetical protein [Desulfovibrionaceae bacterium]
MTKELIKRKIKIGMDSICKKFQLSLIQEVKYKTIWSDEDIDTKKNAFDFQIVKLLELYNVCPEDIFEKFDDIWDNLYKYIKRFNKCGKEIGCTDFIELPNVESFPSSILHWNGYVSMVEWFVTMGLTISDWEAGEGCPIDCNDLFNILHKFAKGNS